MSELRADTITSATDNTDLEIQARGTGVPNLESGFKVNGTVGVPVSALQTGTDGELITWDASGNPATVAAGTAGQVLTSNGAGAAPTMADLVLGAVPISTATASASSLLGFTLDFSTYDSYFVVIRNLIVNTSAAQLYFRASNNGGSSFAANYYGSRHDFRGRSSAGITSVAQSAASNLAITTAISIAGNPRMDGHAWLWGSTDSALFIQSNIRHPSTSAGSDYFSIQEALANSPTDVDYVEFYPSAGNFTSGTIALFGVKNP
jgi:hypothetical protein